TGGELVQAGGEGGNILVQVLQPGQDRRLILEGAAQAFGQGSDLGEPVADRGEMGGLAVFEHRQPLPVGGQLQQRGIERVGGHRSAPRKRGAARERVRRQLVVSHLRPRRGAYSGQGRG